MSNEPKNEAPVDSAAANAAAQQKGDAADIKRSTATLSQFQLTVRRFKKHKVAVASLLMLGVLYTLALLPEFFAPHTSGWKEPSLAYAPPQLPRFNNLVGFHAQGLRLEVHKVTFQRTYVEDSTRIVPLGFFVKGEAYKLFGILPLETHFFGIKDKSMQKDADGTEWMPSFYLIGGDKQGRDVFSRLVYGARISLSVGLVAIVITFLLGLSIGGLSGYVGGGLDNFIQRTIEVIHSFPHLPLWMALGAALPPDWSPLVIYFAITTVLSLLNWTGLARVVRGKILALREEDYAMAARLLGASHPRILFRHLIPGFTSHIIVVLTMSVPGMILGETGLSFLGLGLRPPIVSWGVMMQDCMNIQTVASYPWLMMPVFFIVLTVLCFNFLGDGLRDASDPYASR